MTVVGGVVPEGYDDYARIYHKIERQAPDQSWEPVRWADIAQERNIPIHPGMTYEEIAGSRDGAPRDHLQADEYETLLPILKQHTTTPDSIYVAIWNGRNTLDNHEPRVQLSFRDADYVLLHGTLDDSIQFLTGLWEEMYSNAPDVMWPEDRAWVYGSDIDSNDTCIAASQACIAAILAIPTLETLRTDLTDRVIW